MKDEWDTDAAAGAALLTCLAVGVMILLAAGTVFYLFVDALTSGRLW